MEAYEEPKMEVVEFDAEDVITQSNNTDTNAETPPAHVYP